MNILAHLPRFEKKEKTAGVSPEGTRSERSEWRQGLPRRIGL